MNEETLKKYALLQPHERLAFLWGLQKRKWDKLLRPSQIPGMEHPDTWFCHYFQAGRGSGKSQSGSVYALGEAVELPGVHIGILAPSYTHAEQTCLYGDSGIIPMIPDSSVYRYDTKNHVLYLANGSKISLYSSEYPSRVRGPNFHRLWIDEPADLRNAMELWKTVRGAVRLNPKDGSPARIFVTGTPAATEFILFLDDNHQERPEEYTQSIGSSMDNKDNLDPSFLSDLEKSYSGSRYYQQEIEGKLLRQSAQALWSLGLIEDRKIPYSEDMRFDEVMIAVDPAVSSEKTADETGIIVLGKKDRNAYVLADYSMRASALDWARKAFEIADKHEAKSMVYERNLAGPLIEDILKKALQETNIGVKLVPVSARKSKLHRAEPVAALYEAGRVFHLSNTPVEWGSLEKLEVQMTTWEPSDRKSPDRIDALVWGVDQMIVKGTKTMSFHFPESGNQIRW